MFSDTLNQYIEMLCCTNRELSAASGISAETIGKYRRGQRCPSSAGEQVEKLARGLVQLASGQSLVWSAEEICHALTNSLPNNLSLPYEAYLQNVQELVKAVNISNTELARLLRYDASHISRILSGHRRPSDIRAFTATLAESASIILKSDSDSNPMSPLAEAADECSDPHQLTAILTQWLYTDHRITPEQQIGSFLTKLSEFDLNRYIQAIHFDQTPSVTQTVKPTGSRYYSGLEQMMQAELDFLTLTAASDRCEDMIWYSDIPMEKMAENREFAKKWMIGTATTLTKGISLKMIHDINRPFAEMMLGLESWIPLYMAGKVSSYYLKNKTDSVFHHLLRVSGAAACAGEAIAGHHSQGRYFLSDEPSEIAYYRQRGEDLLSCATPLIESYSRTTAKEYHQLLEEQAAVQGTRYLIQSSLPLFTMTEALAASILTSANVSSAVQEEILTYIRRSRSRMEAILADNMITIRIPDFTEEQLSASPPEMSVPELFIERSLLYTPETYQSHLRMTEQFAAAHHNCILIPAQDYGFRNIDIQIIDNKMAIISKNKAPTIHFVIQHPRIIEALLHFTPPITEPSQA